MIELIDIGLNLTHDSFDRDRDEVVRRAQGSGVNRFIITGTSIDSSVRAERLASVAPGTMFSTAGVHPHHASDFNDASDLAIRDLAACPCVVAVGECGLDFYRNFSAPDQQLDAFEAQLEIAAGCRLPVFLHQRDAHDPFLTILKGHMSDLTGGVAHCFTGSKKELFDCLDLGLYIGITGWVCDERRGRDLQEALPHVPIGRLLLETDAPYLLPRNIRPKPKSRRNEPAFLPYVMTAVSEITGVAAEEIAARTTANAATLFGLQYASGESDG